MVRIKSSRCSGSWILAAILVLACGRTAFGQVIPFATVGDPGNPQDTNGFGAVSYVYRLGKYEVTNGDYTAFLNAVAAADANGLYDEGMSIVRSGGDGSYTYSTSSGRRPVCFVSWYDALRFANWLHNGKPTGPQGPGTTESGAYTFSGPTAVGPRNEGAKFFLPTENEWYKAAYYTCEADPAYWTFPTQNDATPGASAPTSEPNSANYDNAAGGVTDVGSYPASSAYFGTHDQAGNVWEWCEDAFEGGRVIRGGSWNDYELLLEAMYRDSELPELKIEFIGFRVAALEAQGTPFRRGDTNQDGTLDISDAVTTLGYLFLGNAEPGCLSSADATDDGILDLSDSIRTLVHLFAGSAEIPPPYDECGLDPTADELTCDYFTSCVSR